MIFVIIIIVVVCCSLFILWKALKNLILLWFFLWFYYTKSHESKSTILCSSQCQSELTITVLSFSLSRISYFIHTRWYQSNCNLCQSYSGEKWDKCTQKYIDTLYQQCGDSFSIRNTHWEVIVSYEYLHTHVHVPISRNQKALVTHKVSVFLLNDEQIKRFASLNDLKPLKLQNHKVKKQADTGQIIHECIVARAWLWLMYINEFAARDWHWRQDSATFY